jgi:hypothetical protein
MNKILEKNFQAGNFMVYDNKPEIKKMIHVHQIHSDCILTQQDYKDPNQKADGIIFSLKKLTEQKLSLAIKTADCLPILYLSEQHVGLIHAGWRGVMQKIHVDSKLIDMSPKEIFIGPCIGSNSFEVQEDFKEYFPTSTHFIEKSGKLYFDLVKEAQGQLSIQFPDAKITNSGICTFKNNQYNSYRLNKTETRNWNVFQTRA